MLDVHLAQIYTQVTTNFLGHVLRLGTGKNFDWWKIVNHNM